MSDDAELIAKCEDDIWQAIAKMHRVGVRYTVIHFILTEMVKTLEIQGYCEDWLNQFLPKGDKDA